ncbi:MAG: hypothetical protein M1813_006241 [Trichoglossum hirsutum]|nr:MAG: hypothetical protein M1813_006241 [Trichoglossum hirsutum]
MSTTESTCTGCSSAPIENTIPARSARYSISSIRTAYQQFSELKNIREYAEGLQSSLNEVRDEDVNKAPLEYCFILAHEDNRYQKTPTATSAVLLLGMPYRGSSAADMVKLVGNIINVYILLKLWFGWRNKTPLLEALSTNSTVPEDIARSFRNHAGASNIVTSYKTNNTPPTVQLVADKWPAIIEVPNRFLDRVTSLIRSVRSVDSNPSYHQNGANCSVIPWPRNVVVPGLRISASSVLRSSRLQKSLLPVWTGEWYFTVPSRQCRSAAIETSGKYIVLLLQIYFDMNLVGYH